MKTKKSENLDLMEKRIVATPIEQVEKNEKKVSILDELKQKKVIDTVNPITEETTSEVPMTEKVDYNVERYYDTLITEGLTDKIVQERKDKGLNNDAKNDKGKSIFGIILSNLFTFFNMLYLAITIILIVSNSSIKNFGYLPVVIANLIIGIVQEIKAKKTVEKMKLMSAPTATVIRDSEKLEISVKDVVLDDIIFFIPGKQICADSIVVEGTVEVNESLLTGEADAVVKNIGDILYSGSFIVSGVCVARIDKVGKDNYIEKVSSDAKKYDKPKSELLRTLKLIIKIISFIIVPVAVLYLFSPDFNFESFNFESIPETAFIILAMIPAGLFLLTTLALATGVVRLAKNKTLVQELYCIEMLARVDVLCLDKTGTITDGTMRVCDCVEVKNHTDYTIREIIGSMMNAFEDTNPTSEALIRYFDKNKVLEAIDVIPFSSKRKYSAVNFGNEGTFIIGAPEFVLKDNLSMIEAKVERFAKQGCRVLVLGHTPYKIKEGELSKTVKPLALIVLQDHIREDAPDTIEFFKQNGVDIKVISGDNPKTVSEIAQRVGIEGADRYVSLKGMTDDEVKDSIFEYTVFGRVTPNQKRILVEALKAHKKTVAMTGDGVNDILALKEADCSIAMASGSEATRYVSHLVLMDSNFASMPKVVNEGRRVINNIQKTSALYLTKNLFAILLAVMYIILRFNIGAHVKWPFEARHLYLIEYFVLGFATTAMALQPNRDIIKGKFISNVIREILPGGLTILIFNLVLYSLKSVSGFDVLTDSNSFATIAAISTTAVMMSVLFEICRPFNWFRKIVFSIVFIASIIGMVFAPDFFGMNFNNIGTVGIELLIIVVTWAYPMMQIVSFILRKLRIIKK